ncbi:PREDICTED: uncharacterized protein LOC107331213 isoform X4 [Acropora digitifera]|uniref:uncharacterized protein LOC107331213 isoform X4 n=1 Tax=Acropora digitifera TaxID=70779 RepID=UPI00077B0479|nr:PREDICTED: uncharacterized protein LOC107331213 isoform X4 [Acropora digitifera]
MTEVFDDRTLLKSCQKQICELRKQLTEVFDDGTLLKTCQKEICELRKQLTEMGEMLQQQLIQQSEQEEKIKRLCNMISSAGRKDSSEETVAREKRG